MSGPYGDFHGLRTEIGDLSAVLVMLAGIVWVFRAMQRGEYNETELDAAAGQPRVLLPLLRPVDEGHQ